MDLIIEAAHQLTHLTAAVEAAAAAPDVPEINPDWNAPFMTGLNTIASYVLAGALVLTLMALIIALVGIGFKGFGSEKYQQISTTYVGRIAIVAALLGSVNGLMAFFVGFDFGF